MWTVCRSTFRFDHLHKKTWHLCNNSHNTLNLKLVFSTLLSYHVTDLTTKQKSVTLRIQMVRIAQRGLITIRVHYRTHSSLKHQLCKLNPQSSFSFSTRMKLSVGCRRMSSLAVASPTIPAPTIATSYVLKGKRWGWVTEVQMVTYVWVWQIAAGYKRQTVERNI